MRVRSVVFFIVFFAIAIPECARAQYEKRAEFFAGFSHLSFQPGEDLPDEGLTGWYGGVTGYVTPWLGFTAELSGHYGSVRLPPNAAAVAEVDVNQHGVLFGPQIRFLRTKRFAASVHGLVGISRGRPEKGSPSLDLVDFHLAVKQNKLAAAAGVSVDLNITENIAWRILQPDVYVTSFGGRQQNNFRLATGLVVRFGDSR